jgi:hypothetical protein
MAAFATWVFVARRTRGFSRLQQLSELLTLYSNFLSRVAMGPLCPARFNPAMPILTAISDARMMSGNLLECTRREFMGSGLPGMVETWKL